MKDLNEKYLEPRIRNHTTSGGPNSQKVVDGNSMSVALNQLREFLTEILIILKDADLSHTQINPNVEKNSLKINTQHGELTQQQSLALEVRDRVCRILELKRIEFLRIATPLEKERCEEIFYIFAALADEIFLTLSRRYARLPN